MVNVKFTKLILDTEMTVVRNEFERGENSPVSVLSERVAAAAYLWHNYGKATIGSKEDIEKVPIERLAAFYAKFYQPDDAVLVVTGRIDEAKTLQAVAETMGKLPKPTRARSDVPSSPRRTASATSSCGASVRQNVIVAFTPCRRVAMPRSFRFSQA
jgi:zinc protease